MTTKSNISVRSEITKQTVANSSEAADDELTRDNNCCHA